MFASQFLPIWPKRKGQDFQVLASNNQYNNIFLSLSFMRLGKVQSN